MSGVILPLEVITNLEKRNNFSIFAIADNYAMTTKLIRIGNSRGIVIPARILKKYGADDNTAVSLEEEDDRLYLKFCAAEADAERKKTQAFLAACGGSWEGGETVEEIMHSIKEGNVEKEIINL